MLTLIPITLATLAPTLAAAQAALQFDGVNDYVTFGTAAPLGAKTFTIECWFKRTGAGVTTTTGTGGVTNAVPLLTKGRGEAEASNVDMNWFLGIRASDTVLVADFEEGAGQTSPGLNHPIAGVTPLQRGVWYHAAATFDGTTWRLFLNGRLESTVAVGAGRLPRWDSIQHAGVGSAFTSTGVAAGFFAGAIDEARVWDHARPQSGIRDSATLEITAAPGLLGRWGFNEGAGTNATNSIAGSPNGTLTNGPTWVAGSPFSLEYALAFMGTNGYVSFGNPAALGLAQWTVECWFRRDGVGVGTETGTNGIASAVPLVAKGRGEIDSVGVNVNYFLGIERTSGVLVADFEEDDTGPNPGLNHPLSGTTPVGTGVWHHGAASYDGSTLRLYLDGALEGSVLLDVPSSAAGTHPVSIGSALYRNGTPGGFLNGVMDEVRIWSLARTGPEILANMNARLAAPQSGLVARWGLDEGAGTTVASSAGTTLNGAVLGTAGSGWSWTGGAPFDLAPPSPPADPSDLTAAAITGSIVRLTWADHSTNEARFEIERSVSGAGGPFTALASAAANATTYDDIGLTPSTTYCYRVRAANGAGTSGYTLVECATTPVVTRTALQLSGGTYVNFGDPAALDLPQYTIECWFKRLGAGSVTSTGTGGVTDAIPLVTKGRGEAEASNVDLNWFLGISEASDVLCADFEEGAGGSSPSLNHPVLGVTPIVNGVWHHAAVSYDGATWNLYLDGNLETTLYVGQPCASASTQLVALGTGLTSTGVAAGSFDGVLDEVRVWSVARSLEQIRGSANAELTAGESGLVARWGLDEGTGTAVAGSAGTAVNGTITGAGYAWVGPAPFGLAFNHPPALPLVVAPSHGATDVARPPVLEVVASDPDADSVTVTFYGRPAAGGTGADFTLVALPDAQYYTGQISGGSNAILKSQLDWILANRAARNIRYVAQVGDLTDGNTAVEWMRADTAFRVIEDPIATGLADGIPYGIAVGNHDQTPNGDPDGTSTSLFNQYFGESRFLGRSYYGGHYGTNHDDWYELFDASGMEFVVVSLEYDTTPDAAVLQWADDVLTSFPNRRAIVVSHNTIAVGNPGAWTTQGQAIYDQLKDNPNFFLMLSGHAPGEGRRADLFQGRTVNTLLADYQSRANGGSGWLRLLEFSPANGVIRVRTYSPWLGQFEADADSSSQFTLDFPVTGGASFVALGAVKVASGGHATLAWNGLDPLAAHEWYATVSDGKVSCTGPTWGFTTAEGVAPVVAVTAPNGGQTLTIGTLESLTWTATDNVGVAAVDVLLSRDGPAGSFESLASGVANSGSLGWTVTGPPTVNAFLKVIARDAGGNRGEDLSDAAFTVIANPTAVAGALPREFALEPVAPNPAAGAARLAFALPRRAAVRLTIHDVQGREVARLVDGVREAGRHELAWEGTSGAGLYFVRLRTPERDFTRRLILVR